MPSLTQRRQRWAEAGSLLQRRLCFVRDIIQEIEEEDGDDEDEAGVPPATEGASPPGLGVGDPAPLPPRAPHGVMAPLRHALPVAAAPQACARC